jgi:N-acetylglucosaminyldiphosphoundecaprenol N-acetyl-beta-D-mannosaminyltransferase
MTKLLAVRVDETTYREATATIRAWAERGESRYVCVANVHLVMEAHDDVRLRGVVNEADLVTPDGMPLVWILRLKGHALPDRVYGPTLMMHILRAAAENGISVGLYGSTPEVLERLAKRLAAQHPSLTLGFRESPPFHDLTPTEDAVVCGRIEASNIRLLFVGLGCPRQEKWMAAHKGRIQAVMVGVGAAFDFLAGTKRQAPRWMQSLGLEWLFRLATEPLRLWRRYLYNNPRFVALAAAELLGFWRP